MSTKVSRIFKSNLLWKVLSHFLSHPSGELYVKQLAQLLKVGPTSANDVLRTLAKMGLLQRQERARAHFYSLNNDSVLVRSLKVGYFLARLQDVGLADRLLEVDEDLISLCVYGSFVDGTFDEKSDLDILIISQKEKLAFDLVVLELGRLLELEINAEVFTLSKWAGVKKKDRGFYEEVAIFHILLYGSEI